MEPIVELQQTIGYAFADEKLLIQALTHTSHGSEPHNERLEFLGDAVLELCISKYLFGVYAHMSEGDMTRLRAAAVCEDALNRAAVAMGIGGCLRIGKGEERTGGREKPSILSDALEAVIGAVYLDGGWDAAERFVLSFAPALIKSALVGEGKDYKTRLQELLQQNGPVSIRYAVVSESGPDHDKQFITEVSVDDALLGRGKGRSKKEAEQDAARNALARWG